MDTLFNRYVVSAFLALIAFVPSVSPAQDLGAVGPVYEIKEPHAIEYIKETLLKKQRSGELAKWEEESKQRVIAGIRNPQPVPGITRADAARTFYYDPTFVLHENIIDHQGNILYPAGFTKNPLEVFSLSKHILFFDARDRKQVAMARQLITHYKGRVAPILVGGSYLDLMREWKLRVFYDQYGELTERFGITKVPALVSQEGLMLRIDELKVEG